MVHIKRGYMSNGSLVYTVTPNSMNDFAECRDLMVKMNGAYCDDGFLTLIQNVQIVNNIPTFMFSVDSDTLAMNKNSAGVYELVEFTEAQPRVDFK